MAIGPMELDDISTGTITAILGTINTSRTYLYRDNHIVVGSFHINQVTFAEGTSWIELATVSIAPKTETVVMIFVDTTNTPLLGIITTGGKLRVYPSRGINANRALGTFTYYAE